MDAPAPEAVVGYALRLRGIRVRSHMGVTDAERAEPQELVVAVDIELPREAYPDADELDQAANYAPVVRITADSARERGYRLLETFALSVARRLTAHFAAAERVRVGVTKARVPVLPPTDEASVEVTLGKALA